MVCVFVLRFPDVRRASPDLRSSAVGLVGHILSFLLTLLIRENPGSSIYRSYGLPTFVELRGLVIESCGINRS